MSLDSEHSDFARLIAQHQRAVQSYILANVPRWGDADEIWQETSVRLWLEFDKFRPGSNFAAWAIRVAHFEILTWRKKAERNRLVFGDDFIACLESEQKQFTSDQAQARLRALDQCLESSSDYQRELLSRFYEPDRQVQQVAEAMKTSVDAVYKSVQRIRKGLRSCIEQRLQHAELSP
ncbi:sigma-70 family RNA polymerase sigma factor [Rhodopirellula sallentina]|uniref:RNA polymerase sigma-70 ECF-like, Rhodopirellula baltica n=1 Tax=Rhodopirellula sallentina SM41 TaxID=1263870 RepID=M5UP10_9BACT|nr:sigma-70 family RNA polymerase sigma factor [Rhodopirellula sallentina]EMI57723.1 RNA polymerase sigma-70 ECF-like, Rhodopirellula baltica [Rhodopirellula sallentina SM41]